MNKLQIGCIVMAAGNATRFGENKLEIDFNGKSLIRRAMEAVPVSMAKTVIVVTQYPEIMQLAEEFGFTAVENRRPDWGISHTIRLGLEHSETWDAALFMVSDQPMLQKDSISDMLAFYTQHPDHIVGMSHSGVRGNPCVFPKSFFPELLQLHGDHGGNQVIRHHLQRLLCFEVPAIELTDVDSKKALQDLSTEVYRK